MRPGTAPSVGGGGRGDRDRDEMEATMLALMDNNELHRRPKTSSNSLRDGRGQSAGAASPNSKAGSASSGPNIFFEQLGASAAMKDDFVKSKLNSKSKKKNRKSSLSLIEDGVRKTKSKNDLGPVLVPVDNKEALANERKLRKQEKRERDFAKMMLINPQQLAIMMGAMGGASMMRSASRDKGNSTGKAGGRKSAGNGNNGTRPNTSDNSKALAQKQALVDKLASKADILEVKIIKHERAIEAIRQQMIEEKRQRREMGGIKAYRMLQATKAKQRQILEDRLNSLNVRSSEIESKNMELVSAINARRLERQTFERSYKKLKREFKLKQKEMAAMLEQSNEAYEGRQEALSKLEEVQTRAQQERDDFEKEYDELGHIVKHQSEVKTYVQQTAIKRKEKQIVERIAAGNLDAEEEALLKSKLSLLSRELKKQEESINVSKESIHSYEEAFEKLYSSSGIRDMNAIVDQFVRNEDENFTLYNHVQHLTRETEREEDQLRHLMSDMEKYKKELSQNEGHREKIVLDLEEKLVRYHTQLDQVKSLINHNEQSLEAICQATENLFFRIGCPSMRGLENFRSPEIVGLSLDRTMTLKRGQGTGRQTAFGLRRSTTRRGSSLGSTSEEPRSPASPKSPESETKSATEKATLQSGPTSTPTPVPPEDVKKTTPPTAILSPILPGEGATTFKITGPDVVAGSAFENDKALILRLGSKVTEKNIMLYLGTVEQRTTEIMQLYRRFCLKSQQPSGFKGADRFSASGVVVPAIPRETIRLNVHVPSCHRHQARGEDRIGLGDVGSRSIMDRQDGYMHEEDEDEIEDVRPLSSEQLREMTVRENMPIESTY